MADLVPRPRNEVDRVEVSREQAMELYSAAEGMMEDLQLAIALLKRYQRNLGMLGAPDPDIVDARNLMRKHGETYGGRSQVFRIFANGIDITEHPDSIEGDAFEIEDAEVLDSVDPPQELTEGDVD